jgi:hypothetical protein
VGNEKIGNGAVSQQLVSYSPSYAATALSITTRGNAKVLVSYSSLPERFYNQGSIHEMQLRRDNAFGSMLIQVQGPSDGVSPSIRHFASTVQYQETFNGTRTYYCESPGMVGGVLLTVTELSK